MNDVMIDLETLGVTADAPVLQIGAVWFDRRTGEFGQSLEITIDPTSACTKRRIDADTVKWWMRQPDAARESVMGGKIKTKVALSLLTLFLTGRNDLSAELERARHWVGLLDGYQPPGRDPKIWAVGFNDTVQLESLYRLYRMPCPFKFWSTRDCRTIEEISPISRLEGADGYPDGVQHTALSDAKYQVKWLTAMMRSIGHDYPAPVDEDMDL